MSARDPVLAEIVSFEREFRDLERELRLRGAPPPRKFPSARAHQNTGGA